MTKHLVVLASMIIFMHSMSFAQITFATRHIPTSGDHLAKGDFNHDGRTDIVVAAGGVFNVFFQNTVGLLDSIPVSYSCRTVYPGQRAIAAGDINSDGKDDVVFGYADSIGICTQNTSGFDAQVAFQCNAGIYVDAIKIYDVDGDGRKDIVTCSWGGQVVVFYQNTTSGFTKVAYPTAVGAGYDDIEVGKISNDSLVSIVQMGGQSWAPIKQVRIHSTRVVDTTITYHLPVTANTSGVGIGDFYGTGHIEIAASYGGNRPASHIAIWNHPDTITTADTVVSVWDIPQPVEVGKFDCSGRDQIVVAHGGWMSVSVVDMVTGVQRFFAYTPNNASPDGLVVADVNGDGKMDIVSVNSYAGLTVLINTTSVTTTTVVKDTVLVHFDTTVSPSATLVHHDTVSFDCGAARRTDSSRITATTIDSVYRIDSNVLVLNMCTGDTVSNTPYYRYDTALHVHMDTVVSVVRDTVFYHPDSTFIVTSVTSFTDTFTSTAPDVTFVDTTVTTTGYILTQHHGHITVYTIDSLFNQDTVWSVRNHCSGVLIDSWTAPHFWHGSTHTERDTTYTLTYDTIVCYHDSVYVTRTSWHVDTFSYAYAPYKYRDSVGFVGGYVISGDSGLAKVYTLDTNYLDTTFCRIVNSCTLDTSSVMISHGSHYTGEYSFVDSGTHHYYCDTMILNHVQEMQVSGVKVYPNPATEKVFVEADGDFTVALFDILGQEVLSSTGTNKASLDVSTVAAATYTIIVTKTGKPVLVTKIVKFE